MKLALMIGSADASPLDGMTWKTAGDYARNRAHFHTEIGHVAVRRSWKADIE